MRDWLLFMSGVVGALLAGYGLPWALPRLWRKVRRAQAAQKPEYADGQWFAEPTHPAPLSQAQIGDAPVLNKISLRSLPARVRRRRTGR